jgi:hypothetical protein
MTSAFLEALKDLTRLLPAAVARLLLILTLIGAGVLHFTAVRRIEALEQYRAEATAQRAALFAATHDLTEEIKLYRQALLEENKELRGRGGKQR